MQPQPEQAPPQQQEVTDEDDIIRMSGLSIIAGKSNGSFRVGYVTHIDGQRNDSESALPGNRFNDKKVYRGHFTREDGTMESGPLLCLASIHLDQPRRHCKPMQPIKKYGGTLLRMQISNT